MNTETKQKLILNLATISALVYMFLRFNLGVNYFIINAVALLMVASVLGYCLVKNWRQAERLSVNMGKVFDKISNGWAKLVAGKNSKSTSTAKGK
ncbi:hypothetical protein E6W26_28985 [Pseudomonas aeruginosa]|uniref:hypothetical protein n=1 Tax=Pseudomonas aeruginosa TaxID=287 RepID=UPI00109DFAB3|nr:hypothetical protein [Pseudomonas aeruginosa]EKV1241291.1 hypothetical protein [Pseudomonas aeruginosa]EKV8586200.1 hypothetical protein [Pseudomonas aeruginosa]ELN5407418.1 hypothetical protein [Pseudomonas aeruginosa]ELP1438609.1 hypothetical protein [Pseudomonas aeruginosa]THB16434.1 hypothetical protein E6W26_28985 [Pseudomonas aeruginosa]